MRHTVYWAAVETEYGGADLFVNDVPVVRLGAVSQASRPLNEYLRAGDNRASLRLGAGYRSPGGEEPPPQPAALRIEAVEFLDTAEIGRTTLAEGRGALVPRPVGTPLIELAFRADALRGGLPPLDGFARIGPPERALIEARLAELAGWWRMGDSTQLLGFLDDYVRAFAGSYALEREDAYREGFARMVADMGDPATQVRFAPEMTLLEPCGDGYLVDCRRRDRRAAITVHSPAISEYDFNLIVGVRDGAVVAVL